MIGLIVFIVFVALFLWLIYEIRNPYEMPDDEYLAMIERTNAAIEDCDVIISENDQILKNNEIVINRSLGILKEINNTIIERK